MNVGQPRSVAVRDGAVLTSIFKSPVAGRVELRGYNLEGDRQSDLTVHGGPNKAVYVYPSEHYAYWAEQLDGLHLPFGAFGENLTSEGLDEETVHIGDQFRIGSALLQVSQPRMPCFKLALRLNRPDIVKRFWNSNRSGFYFSVIEEGELGTGDPIEPLVRDPEQVSVADVIHLFKGEEEDPGLLSRALRTPLPGSWKTEIQARRAASQPLN